MPQTLANKCMGAGDSKETNESGADAARELSDLSASVTPCSLEKGVASFQAGQARVLSKGRVPTKLPNGEDVDRGDLPPLPNSEFGETSYAYVRRVPLGANDEVLGKALKQLRDNEGCLPPEMRLGNEPRPVYQLAFGMMSVQYKLQVKEGRRHHATSRLNGHTFDEVEGTLYWSKNLARAAAREKLVNAFPFSKAAKEKDLSNEVAHGEIDDDWEVVVDPMGHLRSELIHALCCLVRHAEARGAVLYIPWYISCPNNGGVIFFGGGEVPGFEH